MPASTGKSLPNSPPLVSRLAINPLNPDILYAGWPNGVSKSSDGGRTWQLSLNSWYTASNAIPEHSGRPPTGLAVDPINPQNVYATFANAMWGVTAPFAAAPTAARPGPKPPRPPLMGVTPVQLDPWPPFMAWPLIPFSLTSSM